MLTGPTYDDLVPLVKGINSLDNECYQGKNRSFDRDLAFFFHPEPFPLLLLIPSPPFIGWLLYSAVRITVNPAHPDEIKVDFDVETRGRVQLDFAGSVKLMSITSIPFRVLLSLVRMITDVSLRSFLLLLLLLKESFLE